MQALTNRTIVSLRAKPSDTASLTDEVLYGMPVEILKTEEVTTDGSHSETWCLIRTHYRYKGYCKAEELLTGERTEQFQSSGLKVIMQPYADILSEPRVQGICMQSITRGGRVRFIENVEVTDEDSKGWVKVELVDGRCGYTKEKYLGTLFQSICSEKEEEFRKQVVETAKLYLGTQYRWGGKSPLGIDCSGLASISYMLCGVLIYRDADLRQGYPVREISFEDKKPGDLLYFPGHIAMYIGDGLYIHSTSKNGSDGVVINSLDPTDARYRDDLPGKIIYTGSIFG